MNFCSELLEICTLHRIPQIMPVYEVPDRKYCFFVKLFVKSCQLWHWQLFKIALSTC